MKRLIVYISSALLLFSSCSGVKTLSTGLENEAYLEFIGIPSNYKNGVDVTIDEKNNFKAEVKKDYATRPKGKAYAISTGAHSVSVSYNNKLIYKQQIFVSSQETKKVVLP
ncbi:MAG: hypothetical protein Q8928_13495 [Bacteroidota bacterium]|nr:hypothetical protein [Bacteroidota bacterium]